MIKYCKWPKHLNEATDIICSTDTLTSTQFVSRAVTVEVVALAELATVPLLWVGSLLALACATHAFSVVAADVCAVVFTAGLIHVVCSHVVATAFAISTHTAFETPETIERKLGFIFKEVQVHAKARSERWHFSAKYLLAYRHAPHSKVPFKEHFSLFLTTSLFWH